MIGPAQRANEHEAQAQDAARQLQRQRTPRAYDLQQRCLEALFDGPPLTETRRCRIESAAMFLGLAVHEGEELAPEAVAEVEALLAGAQP